MSDTEIASLAKAFVSTTIERNREKKTCGREYLSKLVFPDLQSYQNFLSTALRYLNISFVILVSYLSLSTSIPPICPQTLPRSSGDSAPTFWTSKTSARQVRFTLTPLPPTTSSQKKKKIFFK